ncbi:MAG: hypothetical protein MK538_00665, partial [Planctomycetes bacterium]|nr:hypothetical protein [Planctomycetota bacterium]
MAQLMRYARLYALPILVAVAAASISSRVVDAHVPLHGVGTVCTIVFDEDKARLTFDLSYDGFWAQAEMIGIDEDKTSVVEADEADAYLERQWKQKIAPRLRALVGGKEVKIRRVGARHENLIGEIFGIPFSLYYDLEIDLPAGDVSDASRRSWSEFEFHDTVVRDETPAKPRFFIPYEGHGEKANGRFRADFPKPQIAILDAKSYVIEGESVLVRFRFEPTDGKSGSAESVAQAVPAPPPDEEPSDAKPDGMGRVTDHDDEPVSALTEGEDLGWLEKIGLLLLAV